MPKFIEILFDAKIFSQQNAGGISKYWAEIILQAFKSENCELSLKIIRKENADRNIFYTSLKYYLNYNPKIPSGSPSDLIKIQRQISQPKEKILHSSYMLPLFLPRKSTPILTVHDLIHRKSRPSSLRALIRKLLLDFSILRAKAYICVSRETQAELNHFYPNAMNKSQKVIYHGVDQVFFKKSTEMNQKISRIPFVLFVGKRDGYKNFEYLLKSFENNEKIGSLSIICVGGGEFNREENELIEKIGLTSRLVHFSKVTDIELAELYSQALALVYPSSMEGFGMPILEAMASGCAVICSNSSSMGEISSGHNYPIDLGNAISLSTVLAELLSKGHAKEKRDAAMLHAQLFTWQKAWHETERFYWDHANR
jgi:glycosyltransferase involved in cell wall biosynthesis